MQPFRSELLYMYFEVNETSGYKFKVFSKKTVLKIEKCIPSTVVKTNSVFLERFL